MTEIPRDQWGRPRVVPPEGGKAVGYVRATTLAGTLDDVSNLTAWKQRLTAIGVTERPDLQVSVAAHRDDKRVMDDLCEQALAHARGGAAATTGTALHTFTEKLDRGEDVGFVPDTYRGDLEAYQKARAGRFTPRDIERFIANDTLQAGGTPDRIDWYEGPGPSGEDLAGYIATDLKTSENARALNYGALKFSIQLAVYVNGVFYDPEQGRETLPEPFIRDFGVITHVPAGSGKAYLHWVNLREGWGLAQLATQVRAARKRKDLHRPFAA